MKKTLILILIGTAIHAQNVDLNLNKIEYGQHVQTLTARSLAMGGAGLARGNAFLASTHNPALVVNSEGVIAINGGFRLKNLEEDRAFPYRDSFGGFVDFGSYYFQNNWYGSMYGQIVYAPDFVELMNLHISTGYLPFIDFNYNYFEEVRSTGFDDDLLAYNIMDSEGQLFAIPVNIAIQPIGQLSIGIGISFLTGELTSDKRIVSKSSKLTDIDESLSFENKFDNIPLVTTFGATYNYDERLAFAFAYRLPFNLKTTAKFEKMGVDTTIAFSRQRDVEYPARLGFGFDYRFENVLAAQIMIDYYYEFWSEFKDSWNSNLNFEDTYNIRVGIEHVFFDGVPFRVGLSFGTLREDKSLTQTTFSLGTGLIFKNIHVDFAVGYSNNQFFQDDLYDNSKYDPNFETRTEPDRINWTQVFGRVDFSYTFK